MKNLFDKNDTTEILNRLEKFTPANERQWGKMDHAQMLAHCVLAMEVASGQRHFKRTFIGKILGPLLKKGFLGAKPLSKGSPTAKELVLTGKYDFEKEKIKLISRVKQFHEGGPAKAAKLPHSFFGHFTADEWASSQYKHLDHHLKQFNA